jgi:hypothetical protein
MDSRSDPLGCLEPANPPGLPGQNAVVPLRIGPAGHWAFGHLFLCPKCESAEITETGFVATCALPNGRSPLFPYMTELGSLNVH